MDFSFTDEQRLLQDSLERFLGGVYGFEARQQAIRSEAGWRPEIWRALAEDVGVLGAALPEEFGGLGGGPVDTMVVMQALGRSLVVEPYLETVVIAAGLLRRAGTPAARDAVGRIIEGRLIATLAWGEPQGRYDAADLVTVARRDGAGWKLDGRKAVVAAAPWAQTLLVSARTAGSQRERQGVSLFLVDAAAAGVTMRAYPTVDGRRDAEIQFDSVSLGADALLGEEGQSLPVLEQVLDEARAALCAEAVGVMGELQRQTVEYAKQRKQFGRAIGDFQVLQHRMVDMFMQVEQSVSMTYMATLKLDLPANKRARAVSAAKVYVGRACNFVGQAAIQTHGGIGLTNELELSHYFKRATMIESALGSPDYHLRRYQEASESQHA